MAGGWAAPLRVPEGRRRRRRRAAAGSLLAGDLGLGAPGPGEPPPFFSPCLENAARRCRPPPRVLLGGLSAALVPVRQEQVGGERPWAEASGFLPGSKEMRRDIGHGELPAAGRLCQPSPGVGHGRKEGGALPPGVTAAGWELGSKTGQSRARGGK